MNDILLSIKKVQGLQAIRGLLFTKIPTPIFFQTRFGIHTFFMRFPIDVAILDKHNSVIKLKENLRPNRIFLWNPQYDRVLELPAGTIAQKRITLGCNITLTFK